MLPTSVNEYLKKHKAIDRTFAFLIVAGLFSLLLFYFKITWFAAAKLLLMSLLIGAFAAIIQLSFWGYVQPGERLLNFRFKLEGLFWGLMIGLVVVGNDFLGTHSISISGFVTSMVIGLVLGYLFVGRSAAKKGNAKIADFESSQQDDPIYTDTAKLKQDGGEYRRGLLQLSPNTLKFYSTRDNEMQFQTPLSEVNPVIKKTKYLPIPNGLNLPEAENKVVVKFPYYWLKQIDELKTNSV